MLALPPFTGGRINAQIFVMLWPVLFQSQRFAFPTFLNILKNIACIFFKFLSKVANVSGFVEGGNY